MNTLNDFNKSCLYLRAVNTNGIELEDKQRSATANAVNERKQTAIMTIFNHTISLDSVFICLVAYCEPLNSKLF